MSTHGLECYIVSCRTQRKSHYLMKVHVCIVNVIIKARRMKQAPYRHLPKGKNHKSIKLPAYRKSFLHTQVLLLSGLPEPSSTD